MTLRVLLVEDDAALRTTLRGTGYDWIEIEGVDHFAGTSLQADDPLRNIAVAGDLIEIGAGDKPLPQ